MTFQGVARGKTIELDQDAGLPEGQPVTVVVQLMRLEPAEKVPDDLPRAELWADRLVFDSSVRPGERIVKGTNLAAEALVAELELGRTDEEMLRAHPELTREDLDALRVYARVPAWIRRTAGAWAEHAEEVDRFVESTYEQRRIERRPSDL
jgi:uncharacterized protein (DUF433 family)